MVELAKHLHRQGLGVVVAVIDPRDDDATSADATARLAAANPSVTFRILPAPATASPDPGPHRVRRSLDTLRLANPVLLEFLRSLPAAVDALLLDMFCVDALDVAAELAIPAYFFFPSPASALAVFLHLPHYYANGTSFREMGQGERDDQDQVVPVQADDGREGRAGEQLRLAGAQGPESARRRCLRARQAHAERLLRRATGRHRQQGRERRREAPCVPRVA
ncbi:Os10g0162980 [Oryza sativa Japonica Group]|uniref:Os10g0162980 protein n=1 Tax=Oryza sativa subsp. japonica TaxID=39947 RepID=A0A0P0XRZ0_ORYSJ|nr:Os10g0162980 [Oryza sativa Japonica Group]